MKAVIFDMDGTMIDNMMVHHRAWQQTLEKYGLPMSLEQVHKEIHGVNTEILERLFADKYTSEERAQIAAEKEETYQNNFRDSLALIPGLPTFMDALDQAGVPMAVASAAPVENVNFVLDTLDIRDRFQSILHSGDVVLGKPNPEIYLKSADILNTTPEECIVFEDSPTGVRAGSAAGAKLVVVTTTHSEAEFDGISGILGFIEDFTDPRLADWLKG